MENNQRRKFISSFGSRVNDTVREVKIAQLIASDSALKEMGLVSREKSGLWGLIVVCSHSLYFYLPENEKALMSMIRTPATESVEQIFCFNNMDGLQFNVPAKPWYRFWGTEKIEFSFIKHTHHISGTFYVDKDAQDLVAKMREAYRS
jgi:hypothetical protein